MFILNGHEYVKTWFCYCQDCGHIWVAQRFVKDGCDVDIIPPPERCGSNGQCRLWDKIKCKPKIHYCIICSHTWEGLPYECRRPICCTSCGSKRWWRGRKKRAPFTKNPAPAHPNQRQFSF